MLSVSRLPYFQPSWSISAGWLHWLDPSRCFTVHITQHFHIWFLHPEKRAKCDLKVSKPVALRRDGGKFNLQPFYHLLLCMYCRRQKYCKKTNFRCSCGKLVRGQAAPWGLVWDRFSRLLPNRGQQRVSWKMTPVEPWPQRHPWEWKASSVGPKHTDLNRKCKRGSLDFLNLF